MGLFDSLERGLERAVKAPFAKMFKAEVQPVEIASAVRGAMDERAAVLGPGRTMVPNIFTVELAETDFERLSSYDAALTDELVAAAEDHADAQRYTTPGPVEVHLTGGDDLETGIFRVRPTSKDGRQRGHSTAASDERAHRQAPRHTPVAEHEDADATRQFSAAGSGRGSVGRTAQRGPQVALEVDGHRHPLSRAVTSLGRDDIADIVIDDPGVSRKHAEVRVGYDGPHLQVLVRDAGSTNGTYLNGDQIGTEELRDGDRLTLGRSTVSVHIDEGR